MFRPIAVDLFAGCGGITEGFARAGFSPAALLDCDPFAAQTLRTRVMFYELCTARKVDWYDKYFREEITFEDLLRKFPVFADVVEGTVVEKTFGRNRYATVVAAMRNALKIRGVTRPHVLLGGPPCQAYSLVGRSRDPDRMEKDGRHFLYQHYLDLLAELGPDFFVFENVPGLLTAKVEGEETFSKILADFAALDPAYDVAPSYEEYQKNPRDYLVDSAHFCVPQKRKRVLLLGYRRALAKKHPSVKNVFKQLIKRARNSVLTVADAIGDLPALKPGEGKDGWHSKYLSNQLTEYQRVMRRSCAGVANHKARTHMPTDLDRYRFFIGHHLNGDKRATLLDLISECPDLTPKHDHLDKFIDRFKVQWWTRPAVTIMAHIAKDGHYYIHPDQHQCRSFTVREAARCQSFPDNYRFEGPRTEQFRQVGNAVPPRMARVVANVLKAELQQIYN